MSYLWQNTCLAFIVSVVSRDYKTTEEYFAKRFSKTVYVSDYCNSEMAIRNSKVKNKTSGCFRSENDAKRFEILRSVIDTAAKNTNDVFYAINLLATAP
jgi:hypothetical protein